ncbi:MAG TPA: hydroxyisourate hydrolase [Pyrinomonadaceae bacterium]|nr:hydroxyisourate hydrolase [Pyrinomonadaceae bacterium]
MSAITTHILDISRGRPAAGVAVTLEHRDARGWQVLGRGATDADGRLGSLLPAGFDLQAGAYRLTFRTLDYFAARGVESFYPEVTIIFIIADAAAHYHVPLLLSPYGYSTYRGS